MNKFKQQSIEALTTQRLLCIPKQISETQRDNSLGCRINRENEANASSFTI